MCNCRRDISENIKKAMNMDNGAIDFEPISGRTSSDFCYTENGEPKSFKMYHSNCPFCGEPYPIVTLEKAEEVTCTNTQ